MFGELSDEGSTGEVVPLFAIQDHVGNNLAITAANVPPLEAFPVTVLPNLIRHSTQVGNLTVAEAIWAKSGLNRPTKIVDVVNMSNPPVTHPSLRSRFATCKALYGDAFVGFHRGELCDFWPLSVPCR